MATILIGDSMRQRHGARPPKVPESTGLKCDLSPAANRYGALSLAGYPHAPTLETAAALEIEPASLRESPARIVWALAWPAVALNSLQVVNTLLDRFFIGHLESSALTAQAGSQNMMFLMFSLAAAMGTASTAIVSRSFGANDVAGYRIASREATSVTVIVGFAFALISVLIASLSAHLILPARDSRSIELMIAYLVAYSAGLPAIFVIQTLAGSLRGIGDTRSPMVISGVQILLHITLNILLIFPTRRMLGVTIPGANLGLAGASTAMSISAWVSAIVYLSFTGRTPLGNLWKMTVPTVAWVGRIMKIALPAAAMMILRVLSGVAFTVILARAPNASTAIAAMGIGFAIEGIMYMPSFGLQVAASALVGQSLGMKRPGRAAQLGWTAAHHAAAVTLILAVPLAWFAPEVTGLLVQGKADIAAESTLLLRLLCATEIMFAYAMVLIGAMQGAGDTLRPMWISVLAMWGLRVPFALFLVLPKGIELTNWLVLPFGAGLGAAGAWIAVSLTQAVQGILCILVFKQGGWKLMKV